MEFIVIVGFVFLLCIGLFLLAAFGDDWLEAWQARKKAAIRYQGTWEVAERTSGSYLTVGCRRTSGGTETGWIEVASFAHNDPDFDEKLLTARATAENRRDRLGDRR